MQCSIPVSSLLSLSLFLLLLFLPPLHFLFSVSTALDEAATALTRMKSERQGGYEAFLRGANQAPSPTLHPSAGVQHQGQGTKTGNAATPSATGAAVTTRQPEAHPHQLQHHQGGSQQQQQPGGVSPGESMQTVQRLLTQGAHIAYTFNYMLEL